MAVCGKSDPCSILFPMIIVPELSIIVLINVLRFIVIDRLQLSESMKYSEFVHYTFSMMVTIIDEDSFPGCTNIIQSS